MSEWDEDPESSEEEESQTAPANPDSKKWEKEAREARKENQTLRSRLNEMLVKQFGEEIVNKVPEGVKDWETRVALVEQFAELAAPKPTTEEANTEAAPPAELTETEKKLAAVASGPPPSAGADGTFYTPDQIAKIGEKDPQRAYQIIQAQSEPDPYGPPGALKMKEPEVP